MESNHLSLTTFGYASGLAAGDKGCQRRAVKKFICTGTINQT